MIREYLPYIIPTLIFSFWAITFLESSLSKLMDLKGNLDYFRGQFAKSFLAPVIDPSFYFILILELMSGLMALASLVLLYFFLPQFVTVSVVTMALICVTVLSLFAGQRIAKDYGGAAGIVPYILVCLFALMALYGR